MEYSFVIAIIPVILVIAFIAWIAKRITGGERLDMKEGVLGVVILMVAVLIMVPMVSSTQTYTWDEDAGELTIKKNVFGGYYAWDEYADEVRSLVIEDGVTIGAGAFDSLTSLEYLSIGDGVTVGSEDFGVGLIDPFGDAVSSLAGYEYVGHGDGDLYQCDPSIYQYNDSVIQGLTDAASSASYLVIPVQHDGIDITGIGASAFYQKSSIAKVLLLPKEYSLESISNRAYGSCTSLTEIELPSSLTSMGYGVFGSCTSLTEIELPASVTKLRSTVFDGCTSLESVNMEHIVETEGSVFRGTAITEADLSSIVTLGSSVFDGCTAITKVVIGEGLTTIANNTFTSWTFYGSDGTTQIDKTVASNLAGKTFQGTAAALVEVAPGQLNLTPQQIQQVHLHDTELQDLKDQISIEPLPLQPSLQEQELTA